MNDDMELVREFAERRSEAAFASLVERHVGLVHSAALRQMGDPHLAEEITQNAFLVLARKAASLSPKTVVSAWLYRTTRYLAADALKARRRRQAREQEAFMQSQPPLPEDGAWEQFAPLLDDAMARLSETDRAALVLRYFENRSARQVAGALGMAEAAAQKRVQRALEKLRVIFMKRGVSLPAAAIGSALAANAVEAAPAGLPAVVISSAAVLGTSGVGLGVGLKAVLPFAKACVVPLISLAATTLPSLVFVSAVGRLERKNYRDSSGFRPQLYNRYLRSFLWGFPILFAVVVFLHIVAAETLGMPVEQGLTLLLMALLTWVAGRSLTIARNPFQMSMFFYTLILTLGTGAVFLGWIPRGLGSLPVVAATLLLLLVIKQRPIRMDYSLFLRAAHGMLAAPAGEASLPATAPRLDRQQLLRFARFLGARYLVINYQWESNALILRVAPPGVRFLAAIAGVFTPFFKKWNSHLVLGRDGTVRAHCCRKDAALLGEQQGRRTTGPSALAEEAQALESAVQRAVTEAWRHFREGRQPEAERALGELPESQIFDVPPSRARSTRWWQIWVGATVLLMAALMVLQVWQPPWLNGWRNIEATEAQVRLFLNGTTPDPRPVKYDVNSPGLALFTCIALPPTNLFTPARWRAVRDEIAGGDGFDQWRAQSWRAQQIVSAPLARRAVVEGWIPLQDLEVSPAEAEASVRENSAYSPAPVDRFLSRCEAWSWVQKERFPALRIKIDGVIQLKLLRAFNCLDLADRAGLVAQIASVQVLSRTPANQPPVHNWREVRGLFFTPCYPALEDTYYSLAALEILGGLDQIDREACIRGILRRHRGRGYFTSPLSGGYNEYHIDGSARDTLAAFESLRILGALERVKDLPRWEFLVKPRRAYGQGANGERTLTWEAVEAWLCQQRLGAIIRARHANPQTPYGSLLSPAAEGQSEIPLH